MSIPYILPTIFYNRNGISISLVKDLEVELPNDIKIYRDKETVNVITYLINEYPSI